MIRILVCITYASLSLVLSGCADDAIGRVSGTVTMDGKPLPNAEVTFQPESGGRISLAMTDTDGIYMLRYTAQSFGALVGEHKVSVSTFQPVTSIGDEIGPPTPEIVPLKYNRATVLTATVRPGSNTVDFELHSQGPIYQQSALKGIADQQ